MKYRIFSPIQQSSVKELNSKIIQFIKSQSHQLVLSLIRPTGPTDGQIEDNSRLMYRPKLILLFFYEFRYFIFCYFFINLIV